MKILIVDDNIDAAESLAEILETKGHLVSLCGDGSSAVQAYREQAFELVFMDLKMPGMDGIEATRHIFEFDAAARVVVLTGNTVQEDLQTMGKMPVLKVLRKPFDVSALLIFLDTVAVNSLPPV